MTTVLIVDDSKVDQRIAGACARELGCDVIFAHNGREAWELVERERPDVVLTDLHMPEMNGLDLVRKIKEEHNATPVVLMTAYGNEQVAVEALRAGAASYVPKRSLRQYLGDALRTILATVQARQQREQVRKILVESTSEFVLGCETGATDALISYLQDALLRLNFCDEPTLLQIAMALTEAINNAVEHGNLELDSDLREKGDDSYHTLRAERAQQSPYRDRSVHVRMTLTPEIATFVVRDEGRGFDQEKLPDPTDPESLLLASGRGILLMHAFMDEVRFNERGNEVTLIKRRTSA